MQCWGKGQSCVNTPSMPWFWFCSQLDGAHGSISSLRNMKTIGPGRRLSQQSAFLARMRTWVQILKTYRKKKKKSKTWLVSLEMASLEVEMGASLPLLASQPSLTGQGETPSQTKGGVQLRKDAWDFSLPSICMHIYIALHMDAYICIYMERDWLIDISPTHINTHTHSREKIWKKIIQVMII